jgi:Fe-S-cluster containining protein
LKKWSKIFNIPIPECSKCGTCCICASPSASHKEMIEKASNGEDFASNFFDIFVPYEDTKEVKNLFPEIFEKSVKAAEKGINNLKPEELVFYRCKYYSKDTNCLIYEDRPSLCRDFPGTPFVILSKKCAFHDWSMECREKYKILKEELVRLKQKQKELADFKFQQKSIKLNALLQKSPEEYKLMQVCPSIGLVSPGKSWINIH